MGKSKDLYIQETGGLRTYEEFGSFAKRSELIQAAKASGDIERVRALKEGIRIISECDECSLPYDECICPDYENLK